MSVTSTPRFDAAHELMPEAGALARRVLRARRARCGSHSKGAQDVVTEADVAVEQLIRRGWPSASPATRSWARRPARPTPAPGQGVWVVDPIDGTQPFVSGMPGWCVSIAFVAGGAVEFGFVYSPAHGRALRRRPRPAGDAQRRGRSRLASRPSG